jgi:uncharacterized protein (DUF2267 family)
MVKYMAEITSFKRTVQKTNLWLKDLCRFLNISDEQKAYRALRSVLQTLRDRLILEEAVHLGDQLPMLVRGFYYEAYRPTDKPAKMNKSEFLKLIEKRMEDPDIDPELAAKAVFRLLQEKISKGEIGDIKAELPEDIEEFF